MTKPAKDIVEKVAPVHTNSDQVPPTPAPTPTPTPPTHDDPPK
jgi:hypothetical protein